MKKEPNISEEEMIRRLKVFTADEDYFPGVLGNPVTFAARWGLSLSKSYRDFKARELATRKRRGSKSKNGKPATRPRRDVTTTT